MKFLERDLEEIIYTSDRKALSERGLTVRGKLFRQLRIGNYGVADLVSVERDPCCLFITVYELKKEKIGISAFLQALGYVKGIESYIKRRKPKLLIEFNIVLVGSNLDTSSTYCYLPELVPPSYIGQFVTNYTYSYDVDGIRFKEERNYDLIDKGFGDED